ncbi:MAG: V-type ATP synthase subunit I [Clostridiales bacterium]|nr:V-type ATP synthase subunit I [Clostridiales bacterium]
MGLAKVEKVGILAHASLRSKLLSVLQEAGIVQVEEVDRSETGLGSTPADISELDHVLHRLKRGMDFLSQFEEKGLLDRIKARKPALSLQERGKVLKFDYFPVLDRLEKIEAEKSELLSHLKFVQKETEFLLTLAGLELPVSAFKSTNLIEVMVGSLPLSRREELAGLTEEMALWHEVIGSEKRVCFLILFVLKEDKDLIDEKLKEVEFLPLYLAEPILSKAEEGDRVRDIIEKNRREIGEKTKKIAELDNEEKKMVVYRDRLAELYDILHNEREKLSASRLLGETEKAVYIEGWVKSEDTPRLRSILARSAEECEVFTRPPLDGEDVPVILENPRPAEPFEVLTKLYGLPHRDSIDPTIPLAPFFFVFVGLCVSEAGYGLIMAILSLLYIRCAKPRGNALQFFRLLFLLGISNIILGTLVGGWFGFPIRQLLVIDALKDPLPFLVLALVLGFVQVCFGTLLSLIARLKKKNYVQAIFVQGGWLLLLPALVAYFLTKQTLWGILALAGASGIVFFASPRRNLLARFFGGLYSLYDISRYLGDVLSYSRLLALGMATSVIAMVVNTLSQTALGIPWVGWLFAALIFAGGHLFNLIISFLGGFVHSMRLQFVEFFTKFFQPGGKPFKPFKLENKFVEFV